MHDRRPEARSRRRSAPSARERPRAGGSAGAGPGAAWCRTRPPPPRRSSPPARRPVRRPCGRGTARCSSRPRLRTCSCAPPTQKRVITCTSSGFGPTCEGTLVIQRRAHAHPGAPGPVPGPRRRDRGDRDPGGAAARGRGVDSRVATSTRRGPWPSGWLRWAFRCVSSEADGWGAPARRSGWRGSSDASTSTWSRPTASRRRARSVIPAPLRALERPWSTASWARTSPRCSTFAELKGRFALLVERLHLRARRRLRRDQPRRDRAPRRHGIPRERMHYIPNGIDLSRWPLRDRPPEAARPSWCAAPAS